MRSYWDQRVASPNENSNPNVPTTVTTTKLSIQEKIISKPNPRTETSFDPFNSNILTTSIQLTFIWNSSPTSEHFDDSDDSDDGDSQANAQIGHSKLLFIGNINCTDNNLIKQTLYDKIGQNKIVSYQLCKPLSCQKKRHALVTLVSEEFVHEILSSDTKAMFNNTSLHKCVVDRYRCFSQDPDTTLFLYIEKEWSDKQINSLFSMRLQLNVVFERSLSRKGRKLNFGFVYFEKTGDLEYAFFNQEKMVPFLLTRVKAREHRRSSEDIEDSRVFLDLEGEGLLREITDKVFRQVE
jgi:hypothetical protein